MNVDDVVSRFAIMGCQNWGQTALERAEATFDFLRLAGFNINQSGSPFMGSMSRNRPITGPDGEAAFKWLDELLNNVDRSDIDAEVRRLKAAALRRVGESVEPHLD